MQLTILGGGGFRVPLVFRALCEDPGLGVERLVLYDVAPERLAVVMSVVEQIAASTGGRTPRVDTTTDLREAVRGADFVFSAIRVAGLAGRAHDERCALGNGAIGQETTGAGGVLYGLRTVPEALRMAEVIASKAPTAWVINFTNPAGMITEAMQERLGDRVIGICDSPVGLFRRVARVLGVETGQARFDYAGLNHLGWLRRVIVDGRDRLPELLADDERLLRIEEGRLFGASWLRALGAIPNEYLWYWYYRTDALHAELAASQTRGEFLLAEQNAFYAAARTLRGPAAYEHWDRTRRTRETTYMADSRAPSAPEARDPLDLEGGGYDKVALTVMRSVAGNSPSTLVLNVANRGTMPFLDDAAVIEVPCALDGAGPRPLALEPLDLHAQGMVTTVKAVERAAIQAAVDGSRSLAVKALALHPLVGSVPVAARILSDELASLPELARILVKD